MGKIIDIIGIALFLGLILRYGESAAKLVAVSSHSFSELFATVSLQNPDIKSQQVTTTLYR